MSEVRTRSALRFHRGSALVDTLYVLAIDGDPLFGEPAKRLAVYSESARDVLKAYTYIETNAGKVEEIAYATPRRILYLKDGRVEKALEGDELSALTEAVVRALQGKP